MEAPINITRTLELYTVILHVAEYKCSNNWGNCKLK